MMSQQSANAVFQRMNTLADLAEAENAAGEIAVPALHHIVMRRQLGDPVLMGARVLGKDRTEAGFHESEHALPSSMAACARYFEV